MARRCGISLQRHPRIAASGAPADHSLFEDRRGAGAPALGRPGAPDRGAAPSAPTPRSALACAVGIFGHRVVARRRRCFWRLRRRPSSPGRHRTSGTSAAAFGEDDLESAWAVDADGGDEGPGAGGQEGRDGGAAAGGPELGAPEEDLLAALFAQEQGLLTGDGEGDPGAGGADAGAGLEVLGRRGEGGPWRRREPKRPVDYMALRLQSPSEVRGEALRRDAVDGSVHYAEVLGPEGIGPDGPVPGGLYCERSFGLSMAYQRRNQMGVLELPWPCAHVWFTGNARLGHAGKLLDKRASEVFDIRQLALDVYTGEWTAAQVWPLRKKYGAERPQVPAIGSPVAAAPAPALRTGAPHRGHPEHRASAQDSGRPGSGDLPELRRQVQTAASSLRSAFGQHMPPEAVLLGRALRRALADALAEGPARRPRGLAGAAGAAVRLGFELPSLMADMFTLASIRHQQDAAAETVRALPHLIKRISTSFQSQGVPSEEVDQLLARARVQEPDERPGHETPLRLSARQDLYTFWRTLTVPGLDEDLEDKLSEIQEALEGQLESYDVARVLTAVRKLQTRAHAALDIALWAYAASISGKSARSSDAAVPEPPAGSRFGSQSTEVSWYAREMTPAAFHLEDVERLQDRAAAWPLPRRLPADGGEAGAPPLGAPPAREPPAAAQPGSARPGQLTTPRGRGGRRPGGEARFYRRGGGADARWHVPLQDDARPGRGGGLHPVRPGQTLPPAVGPELLRFCGARPRPAGAPPGLPSSPEAEGSLFVGVGATGVRQMLCAVEPLARLRELYRHTRWLDAAMEVKRHLGAAPRAARVADAVRHARVGLAEMAAEGQQEARARVGMLEAAASKFQLPEWMVFLELPVLPPDLRLRSAMDPEEFPDDLNLLYKDVLKACRNLEAGLLQREPTGLLRYHKFALQKAVDQVIDNGRIGMPVMKRGRQEMESVAMRLKGKRGRLRKNMLGKRVDYSARTVIVVDPQLNLDECGMPFMIARTLFSVFLVAELRREAGVFGHDLAQDEELLERFDAEAVERQWELLSRVMEGRRVVLNRAPTLHRLSMQAFQPRLVGGQALKIHPLVCSPFNADFDGDTMTMHLGLGGDAQRELAELMAPSSNLSSPATGDPVIGPTQDMVLGIYYLTAEPRGALEGGEPARQCRSLEELEAVASACHEGELPHTLALEVPRAVLLEAAPEAVEDDALLAAAGEGGAGEDVVRTTAGRALFFLLVHGGFRPPRSEDAALLGDLDGAPLAPALAGWR